MILLYKGGHATFSIAITVAKAFIEQGDNEFPRILKIWNGLGPKLIGRMDFKKRVATIGKVT